MPASTISLTDEQIAVMFAEWDRRFAADRAAFLESIAPLLRGSPTSYGELVAQWFLKLHTAEAAKCA